MAEETGIQPMYDLARNQNNDMCNGGNWFWIVIFILFFAFGNNGWGNNQTNTMEDEFIKRDIFNTNQNVSNIGNQNSRDILESRYTTQLGLSDLNTSMLNSSNETQKEILQNRYDNSLQTNTLQAQMQNCCCELKTAIHAEGEATRAQMQNDKIEELRASLNTTSNAYNNVSLANNIIQALQPTPKPAYMVSSPYAAYPPYLMAGTTYGTTV